MLDEVERGELMHRAARYTRPHREVLRAKLVLLAAEGCSNAQIGERLGMSTKAVGRWLMNPVSALGVYMLVVGNGQLPDPELLARLRKNAHRWAPGAACANEAITASGRSPRAFYRRELEYHGPVLALWGERDRLVPLAHRDGVMTAFPQAQISVWKKMGHHPQRERPSELARFIEAVCVRALPSARSAGSRRKQRRGRVAALTPEPLPALSATARPAAA